MRLCVVFVNFGEDDKYKFFGIQGGRMSSYKLGG